MNPEYSIDYLPETALLIGKDLGITPLSLDPTSEYGVLRQWLATYIEELLQSNPDYLHWVLYRLDITQEKATAAFKQVKRRDTALLLADLIIERECQKTQTRQWYKEKTAQEQHQNDQKEIIEDADRW